MRIALPKALKPWYKDFKPTDGEIAFITAVLLFSRLFGLKTYQQWETGDIRAFIRSKSGTEILGRTQLKDLEAQGVIECINDLDGIESFRINQSLTVGDQGLFTEPYIFEVNIRDEGVIMALSFFMGRIVDVHENSEIKDLKIARKIKANGRVPKVDKATTVALPEFYTQQFKHFQQRHGKITQ